MEWIAAILGFLTSIALFLALPVWFWWFQTRITDYFPQKSQGRARRYAFIGAVWLAFTIWLIWSFLLPDWWVKSTYLQVE